MFYFYFNFFFFCRCNLLLMLFYMAIDMMIQQVCLDASLSHYVSLKFKQNCYHVNIGVNRSSFCMFGMVYIHLIWIEGWLDFKKISNHFPMQEQKIRQSAKEMSKNMLYSHTHLWRDTYVKGNTEKKPCFFLRTESIALFIIFGRQGFFFFWLFHGQVFINNHNYYLEKYNEQNIHNLSSRPTRLPLLSTWWRFTTQE